MEKEAMKEKIRKIALEAITDVICVLIMGGLTIILIFHKFGPFFPVLFLFDFCFWFGHPIFVKYVLKRKWYECTKNDLLALKYILIPSLIMELLVLLYYYKATYFIITTIIENSN